MNIPKEVAIVSIEACFAKKENCGKNEFWFQIYGLSDTQILFDIAHHYRDAWERIEVQPLHQENIALLYFQGRKMQ